MRSRVNKNQALYTQIASDTESKVESHDLSHFANRLNAIDEQFGKMDVSSDKSEPNHARELQRRYHEENQESSKSDVFKSSLEDLESVTQVQQHEDVQVGGTEFSSHNEFDTFESTYLSDFLQEVKEYNVKQGYRDIDNTSTNIMKDLNLDIEINKSRRIPDQVAHTPFIPEDIDDLIEQIDPLMEPVEALDLEPVSFSDEDDYYDNIENTKYFTAVDHMQRFDQEDAHLQETIAMEVMRMVDEDVLEPDYGAHEVQLDLDLNGSIEESIEIETNDVYEEEALVLEDEPVALGGIDEYKLTPFGIQPIKEGTQDLDVVSKTEEIALDEVSEENDSEPVEEVVIESNEVTDSLMSNEPFEMEESEVARRLLEQTQTLQIKIIDQEKNIEEISDTMVRTNRLLNVTLSLLMLAIFVVIMLIVSNLWR